MRYRRKGEALGDMVAVYLNNMEVMIIIRNGEFIGFCELFWKSWKKENNGFRLVKNQLKQLWTLEGLHSNIF